jgi:hypothetical protein
MQDAWRKSCCRPHSRDADARRRREPRCDHAPASRCGHAARADDRSLDGPHADARNADARCRCARGDHRADARISACRISADRNCARHRAADARCGCRDHPTRLRASARASARCDQGRARNHVRPIDASAISTIAKALARAAAIRRATGELLVAAKFLLGAERPVATRTISVTRRARAERTIALRTITAITLWAIVAIALRAIKARTRTVTIAAAETFAARRIGALLTAAIARRVGLPLAELLVGEAAGRTRIAAVATRGAVIPVEIRTLATRCIAARAVGTLVAATGARRIRALLAVTEILARTAVRTIATTAARGTVVAVEAGRTRIVTIATRRIAVVAARRAVVIALAGVGLRSKRLGAKRFAARRLATERSLLTAASTGRLRGVCAVALGEFLVGSTCGAGAALAGSAFATGWPAARGAVVFVVVAGHEGSHCSGS